MLDFSFSTDESHSKPIRKIGNEKSKFVSITEVPHDGFDFLAYATDELDKLQSDLHEYGAILVRGLNPSVETFAAVCDLFGDVTSHSELSSPRSSVSKGVYTSTDHPNDQTIQMHNEQSYLSYWPMRASFHCVVPAKEMGNTPVADCRNFESELPDSFVRRLKDQGVCYIRNIGPESTIGWRKVFSVATESELEEYCEKRGIRLEWDRGYPRTMASLPAFRAHAYTGESCFFNNIVVASPHSLGLKEKVNLTKIYGDERRFPINVCWGDGTIFSENDIATIMAAYNRRTFKFDWQKGDILIADNMLTAHSREPFVGPRKIVVRVNDLFDSLA